MIEQIEKHRPDGATHWRSGFYFRYTATSDTWEVLDNDKVWKATKITDTGFLFMTRLSRIEVLRDCDIPPNTIILER